jgi:hypothetical protein
VVVAYGSFSSYSHCLSPYPCRCMLLCQLHIWRLRCILVWTKCGSENIMPLSLKTLGILKEQCKERSIQINTAHQKRIIWMWRWKDDRASLLDSSHRVIGRIESVTSTGVNCYVQIGIQIARMDRFQDMYLIKLVWFWFELWNDVRTAKKKWTLYVLLDHLHKWHGYQGIRSS